MNNFLFITDFFLAWTISPPSVTRDGIVQKWSLLSMRFELTEEFLFDTSLSTFHNIDTITVTSYLKYKRLDYTLTCKNGE